MDGHRGKFIDRRTGSYYSLLRALTHHYGSTDMPRPNKSLPFAVVFMLVEWVGEETHSIVPAKDLDKKILRWFKMVTL